MMYVIIKILSLVFKVTNLLSYPSRILRYYSLYSFSRGESTEEDMIDLNSIMAFVKGFWFFFLYLIIISSITGTWYPVAFDKFEQSLSMSPSIEVFLSKSRAADNYLSSPVGHISRGKYGDYSFRIYLYFSLILLSVLLLKSLLSTIRFS